MRKSHHRPAQTEEIYNTKKRLEPVEITATGAGGGESKFSSHRHSFIMQIVSKNKLKVILLTLKAARSIIDNGAADKSGV